MFYVFVLCINTWKYTQISHHVPLAHPNPSPHIHPKVKYFQATTKRKMKTIRTDTQTKNINMSSSTGRTRSSNINGTRVVLIHSSVLLFSCTKTNEHSPPLASPPEVWPLELHSTCILVLSSHCITYKETTIFYLGLVQGDVQFILMFRPFSYILYTVFFNLCGEFLVFLV